MLLTDVAIHFENSMMSEGATRQGLRQCCLTECVSIYFIRPPFSGNGDNFSVSVGLNPAMKSHLGVSQSHESCIVCLDTANLPYGPRPAGGEADGGLLS